LQWIVLPSGRLLGRNIGIEKHSLSDFETPAHGRYSGQPSAYCMAELHSIKNASALHNSILLAGNFELVPVLSPFG
jgi:hypothetical protein